MKQLSRWLLAAVLIILAYRNRYKLMNIVLGNMWIRKWAVSAAMNIPGVRSRFIQSAFRPNEF